jgi:hypothetical protein
MCVSRAFDTLEYLSEHPPAAEILAAVHLKQKSGKRKAPPKTSKAAFAQMQAMSGALAGGLTAEMKLPSQLREMAMWALDQNSKLNKKT